MHSSESYVAPEEAEKKEKVKSDLNTMKPVKKLNINKLKVSVGRLEGPVRS